MKPHLARIAALLVPLAAMLPARAAAQTFPFEYAVKVVCGKPDASAVPPGLVPGTYATIVNVHNPSREATRFRFKVAVAGEVHADSITGFRGLGLGPDGALGITCREVRALTGRADVDGFVVVQTLIDLDVVAVYTAMPPAGGVSTMDVERQVPRRTQ